MTAARAVGLVGHYGIMAWCLWGAWQTMSLGPFLLIAYLVLCTYAAAWHVDKERKAWEEMRAGLDVIQGLVETMEGETTRTTAEPSERVREVVTLMQPPGETRH